MSQELQDLAQTDVYLIDQILKGRIAPGSKIIDLGCGAGRNLPWFLRQGFDVTALDANPESFKSLEARLEALGLTIPVNKCIISTIEDARLGSKKYDLVISNAVFHFATGHDHFKAMLAASWRLVAPGGLFFARMTSSIGIESLVKPMENGRFSLPDGSERYLVSERLLKDVTDDMGAELLDPIKSTIVQSLRTMTTWVVRRPG